MTCEHRLKHLRILLVEDEEKLAHLLRDAIGNRFGEFSIAYDGKSGLEAARKFRPDLIITDITMPGMNGLEMSATLRKERPDLPVVILSAYSEKEYFLEAIDIGITKYLIKPFDPDELLDVLCVLAEKTQQTKHSPLMPPFRFDRRNKKLFRGDIMVRLTQRELLFIDRLIESENYFLPSEAIKVALWGDADASDERLRVFINRLRHKSHPDLIGNMVGQGYFLRTSLPGATD